MRAYFVATSEVISPFGELARDCLVMDATVHQRQQAVLRKAGLDISLGDPQNDPDEHLLVDDDLLFSLPFLESFLRKARSKKVPARCLVQPGLTTQRLVVSTQDLEREGEFLRWGLRYRPAASQRQALEQAIVVSLDEQIEHFPVPTHMFGTDHYPLPITDQFIVRIHHWTNLWAVHLLLLLSRGASLSKASKFKLLWLALRARSLNKWRVLAQTNVIGKNCDIHPTAYIEGCTIGDGCVIGAGAVLRLSHVGDGSQIANNTTIICSSLGRRSAVLNGSSMQFAVAWSGLFSTSPRISCSLLGRDCFMGGGTTLTDFRLDNKTMRVQHKGQLVDTHNECVGSCLGHGVYIGSGTIVAPGREIPNGYRIAAHESRILRSIRGLDSGEEGFRTIVRRAGAVAAPRESQDPFQPNP